MDRKEFLKYLWKRLFKPIITLILLYFSTRFLIEAFRDKGGERFSLLVVLSLTILYFAIYFSGKSMESLKEKIISNLSNKAMSRVKIIGKAIDYLAVLLLGAVLYKFWEKDIFLASMLSVLLIIDKIKAIIRKEKMIH